MWAAARCALVALSIFVFNGVERAHAAIICGVVFRVCNVTEKHFSQWRGVIILNAETKFCPMARCSYENIIIFDPPPEIPFSAGVFYILRRAITYECLPFLPWADKCVLVGFRIWKIKINWNSARKSFAVNIYNCVYSWSRPTISKDNMYAILSSCVNTFKGMRHKTTVGLIMIEYQRPTCDIGPKLSFGISYGDLISPYGSLGRICRGLDRLLHIFRLLVGGSSETGSFPEQPARGNVEAPREQGEQAVEGEQEEIGGFFEKPANPFQRLDALLKKWLVPLLILASFGLVWWLMTINHSAGGWAILAFGWGWSLLIFVFGILHR